MTVAQGMVSLRPGLTLFRSGAVYTPPVLAEWTAELLADNVHTDAAIRIVDPACGDGALLAPAARRIGRRASLNGFDIESAALQIARSQMPGLETRQRNSLLLMDAKRRSSALRGGRYDAVLMNPPWGADPGFTRQQLRGLGYELASGQFDTYDLFMELSLQLLKPGGILIAIIPDSLFLPEHEPLRRMLASRTEIRLVARLGEGFFDGVFRGTTVIVAANNPPPAAHAVACVRLSKDWRQRVLRGDSGLSEASAALGHFVQQQRFLGDVSCRFNIDLSQPEEDVTGKIAASGGPWTEWFVSGRGVELSKTGRILRCSSCGSANPLPRVRTDNTTCTSCGSTAPFNPSAQEVIVRPGTAGPDGRWQPFLVGEDVGRYSCSATRQIRLGVQGINYKTPETFAPRKLLVRKTGLGIKAAIDETAAYTNQVVFHYVKREGTPWFVTDYVLGVLNSRVLLAYHLKSLGETEWRSHPYVTQKVIASLPIPKVVEGTWQWCQALAIADIVRDGNVCKCPGSEGDLQIERLCAGLFGLTAEDCGWVTGVLDGTEGLEPLRTLRLESSASMAPLLVG